MAEVPDDDGFVTVINKRSHQVLPVEDEMPARSKNSRLSNPTALPNFYQFQAVNHKKNRTKVHMYLINIINWQSWKI